MPQFIIQDSEALEFRNLDAFTQGYIEALFFTECDSGTRENWNPETDSSLPGDVGFLDFGPGVVAAIVADCKAWQEANKELLFEAYARDYNATQAGRDYWFTRNRHGVGFWDRKELEDDSEGYEALTAEMLVANQRSDSKAWDEALTKRKALEGESLGERLSTRARQAGEVWATLGDDKKVYVS